VAKGWLAPTPSEYWIVATALADLARLGQVTQVVGDGAPARVLVALWSDRGGAPVR
jgi:hypothetical protein